MLHDILWYIILFIVFAGWYLYIFETLPKIRKRRTVYLRDWGFGAFQPLKNLNEYRNICEEENESLIWYKVQLLLLFSFIVLGVLSIVLL